MSSGLYNTHKADFDTTLDLTRIKPYGDTMNDGKVQTSFTLPVCDDARGEEAARVMAVMVSGLSIMGVAYHLAGASRSLGKGRFRYLIFMGMALNGLCAVCGRRVKHGQVCGLQVLRSGGGCYPRV